MDLKAKCDLDATLIVLVIYYEIVQNIIHLLSFGLNASNSEVIL